MKIKKLIGYFTFLEEKYQTAIKERYTYDQLAKNNIEAGLCSCIMAYKGAYRFQQLFTCKGYYREYVKNSAYITKIPYFIQAFSHKPDKEIKESLKFRLNFIQEEIKSLNSLLKKGYTDV